MSKIKKRNKDNIARFSLHPGDPVEDWSPQEIVLVYLRLTSPNTAAIDPLLSCRYFPGDFEDVDDVRQNIDDFAAEVADGIKNNKLVTSGRSLYCYATPLASYVFAMEWPCYIILALEQSQTQTWQYEMGRPGMVMMNNPAGQYSNLMYIVDNQKNDVVNGPGCVVAYFEAQPTVNGGYDHFTINVDNGDKMKLFLRDFDPAIKDDGHG